MRSARPGSRSLPKSNASASPAQPLHEISVEFDHLHAWQPLQQRIGQRAEARTDLDHDVVWLRVDRADDAMNNAVIDEEVLSEPFAGHMALMHV